MHHTYRLLPVWSSRSDTWADVMSSCPGWMGPCWSLDSSSRTGSFSGGIAGLYWNSPSLIGNSVDSSYRAWTIERNFFWRFHIENCLIILLIWDKCLINQDHVSHISVKPSTFTVMWKKNTRCFLILYNKIVTSVIYYIFCIEKAYRDFWCIFECAGHALFCPQS